jgi:hypothetical protein
MKKPGLVIIMSLIIFLSQAQDPKIQFIDSIVSGISRNNTILLFTELRDTVDNLTGHKYSQRNSYYNDWVHKELRYIEVYRFDKLQRRHNEIRFFSRRNKNSSGNQIIYIFLRNQLIKAKITPSPKQCRQCFGEYYFWNDKLIFRNEVNLSEEKNDFVDNAVFFLERLRIAKK